MRGICTKKIGAISQLGAEKITFPPKPDRQTDIHIDGRTDGRKDICFYREASLQKKVMLQRLLNIGFFNQNSKVLNR